MKYIIPILIYSICYQIVHTEYLVANFEYMGYISNNFNAIDVCITTGFLLLPLAVRPKNILFLEIAFTLFYLLLYIPVMITFLNTYVGTGEIIYNQSFLTIGFLIIFTIPKIKFPKLFIYRFPKLKIKYLIAITIVMFAFLFVEFRHTYKFVSFEDVYDQRSEISDSSALAGYFVLWVTYFIGPLLLTNGLIKRNYYLCTFGFLTTFLTYGIGGSKIALFIPLIIIAIFWIYKKGISILKSLSYGFSALILIILLISQQFFMVSAVILMRTFGIAGLLTYQYNEFFKNNPQTYFSHVNIVNFFTGGYPYDQSLGLTVSAYFDANSKNNQNANFIATDGIASLGLPGIILIAIIVGLYFAFTKAQINKKNQIVVGIMSVPFCFIILNVGLFTSLLSGGFIFINLYYLFIKD